MFWLLAASVLCVFSTFVAVEAIRRWAVRSDVLDIPNERSSHVRPIPRGGGLGIVAVTLVGTVGYTLASLSSSASLALAYTVGAFLIAAVGWLDDLSSLSNRVRFAAHSLAAALVIIAGGYIHVIWLPLIGGIDISLLGLPLTFLWIVGLTNSYNFMDGIDGIAGGQAVIAGLGWAVVGYMISEQLVIALGLFVAGSSLGFLGHNWSSARIFMGDVGSGFLGFTFASLTVFGASFDSRLAFVGVLLVWPFIFDAAFTFLNRARRHEDVFSAHRSHLYQRLVIAGYSHRFVSTLYIALAVVGCVLSISWMLDERIGGVLCIIVIPLLASFLWSFVNLQEQKRTKAVK